MENTVTSLQFEGFPLWVCLVVAALAFVLAFVLYRRETKFRSGFMGWLLPLLRSLAVLLCMLLLAEPVLRHDSTRRQESRLRFLVDGSRSMDVTDPGLSTARKLRLLESGGAALPAAGEAYLKTAASLRGLEDHLRPLSAEALDLNATQEAGVHFRSLETGLGRLSNLLPAAPGAIADTAPAYQARAIVQRFLRDEQQRQEDRWKDGGQADEGTRRYYLSKAREALFKLAPPFEEIAASLATDPETRDRLASLGTNSRWSRMEELLVGAGGGPGWIERLADDHEIEVIDIPTGESWWWQRKGKQSGDLPAALDRPLVASRTDLAETIAAIASATSTGKGAIIVLSDGNHNALGSPEEAAELLGATGLPVHAVGFGADQPPPDLAISNVLVPKSVYRGDRIAGRVALDDTLPPGRKFEVSILHLGEECWSQELESTGEGTRLIPFEIGANELITQLADADADADGESENQGVDGDRNLPLALTAQVRYVADSTAAGAAVVADPALAWLAGNDSREFAIQAMGRKRKVLVLDGRPRWDLRYLKNHFDRDPQWASDSVIAMPPVEEEAESLLPDSKKELFEYDLVFLGDIPAGRLTGEEMKWLLEFVSERGGGLVLVDGARRHLAGYADTEAGPLMPVSWKPESAEAVPVRKIRMTAPGRELGALQWSASASESAAAWDQLPPPQWIGTVEPNPGAEVLLEAIAGEGESHPVMVTHRYGAGKVVYLGFDESWRWRKGRDDDPQRRFWLQLADWAGEIPFAAKGERVALGADRITLSEGETATLRTRFKDIDGNSDSTAELEAVFTKDGQAFASYPLAGEADTGMYRGKTAALPAGKYEVRIRDRAMGETYDEAVMQMFVAAHPDLEMTRTALNRGVLGSITRASSGRFHPEEDAEGLIEHLESLVEKVEESRVTYLWRSWWWFLGIIVLLTLEWILRKRAGYV